LNADHPPPTSDPGWRVYIPVLVFALPTLIFLVAVAAIVIADVRQSPRYSLRAGLIVVTFIAVTLGLIMYMYAIRK
jgi:hypothetical protein